MPATQTQTKTEKQKQLEEEELRKMVEEEEALKTATEALEASRLARQNQPAPSAAPQHTPEQVANAVQAVTSSLPPAARPVPQKTVGDVPVIVLRDETSCFIGGRRYSGLRKGAEIMMAPEHAAELSEGPSPLVSAVRVVSRR